MIDRFAHRLRLDQIRDGERLDLVADEDERRSIAQRLGLPVIRRLGAHATLLRTDDAIRAEGRLAAVLDQRCVVTGEPLPAHIDEPFTIRFVAEPAGPDSEIELGEEDCDTIFYASGVIDLGTAIADTLALSLDPYPRSAVAANALKEAGVLSEEQAGPFAILARLKRNERGEP